MAAGQEDIIKSGRKKGKDALQKLTLLGSSIVICFLLLELVLKVFFPQISDHGAMFQRDDLLGWTFTPDKRGAIIYPGEAKHYIQTNASGFRDASFEKEKSGKRIMFIGDSFVSNISVKDEEVFTEVLEKQIPDIEAMNFGVNGYGQVQELLLLNQWIDKIKPDLVVLMVYLRNDFTDNVSLGKGTWRIRKPSALWNTAENRVELNSLSPAEETKGRKRFYHKLHLYHFIARRISHIRHRMSGNSGKGSGSFSPSELHTCQVEPDAKMLELQKIMKYLILQMHETSQKRNTPFLMVIAPSIIQIEDRLWQQFTEGYTDGKTRYDREYPGKWFKAWGEEEDIHTLDLYPILYQETIEGSSMYNFREQHWTSEGNLVVAEALRKYIKLHFNSVFPNLQ